MATKLSKRIIAIFLCALMLCGNFMVTGSAAGTEYISGNYTYTVSSGKTTITAYKETATGNVEIPEKLGGYPVVKIDEYAFFGCTLIESVVIPTSVKEIGKYAFAYCMTLASVTIPSSVTSIGEKAFNNSNKVVIYCEKGSYAEKYANNNGIKCVIGEKVYRIDNMGIESDYTYSDSYFDNSSTEYSQSLMQLSMVFALAAMVYDGGPYTNKKPESANKMLKDLGFNIYENYGYDIQPASVDPDSVACVIGAKNIDSTDTTIIGISVRGGGYEGEWGSNFNVGSSYEHSGFYKASQYILKYLNEFISENSDGFCSNIKFWITGYSRAAATANLVAAQLNDGISSRFYDLSLVKYNRESVYAYTFETPQNTVDSNTRSNCYSNIFNIVNKIDPVPKVAMSDWGFSRYGIDYYIPSAEVFGESYKYYRSRMEQKYNSIVKNAKTNPYKEDFTFAYLDVETKDFLGLPYSFDFSIKESKTIQEGVYEDILMSILANDITGGRTNYSLYYQDSFCKFFKKYPLKFDDFPTMDDLWKYVKDEVDFGTIWSLFVNKGDVAKTLRPALASAISKWLKDTKITYGDAYDLLGIIDDAANAVIDNINVLITAIYNQNITRLFIPHFTEVTFSWVMSCPEAFSKNTTYTKAKFNCPVDVTVYDSSGNVVAAIIDNETIFYEGSTISSYLDKNGQKVFCLPNDQKYSFKVIGTDSGTMTCSFSDYDFNLFEEKNITNYYNIPITTKTDIMVTTNKKNEYNDPIAVTMVENGKVIKESEKILSETGKQYTVNVETGSHDGVVLGGGTFIKGEFTKVTAFENSKCEFVGWYLEGKMVSSDLEYRFMVEKSCSIIGVFKERNLYSISIPESDSLNYKSSIKIVPIVNISSDNRYEIFWSSSNPRIATVDDNGNVYGAGKGTATITCTVTDEAGNSVSDTCKVTVKYAWWQWIIKIVLFGWIWY